MSVKRSLLKWYSRPLWPFTVVAFLIATIYLVLVRREPLQSSEIIPWIFIFMHCGALSFLLGRDIGPQEEFLFTRGFSRDDLRRHRRMTLSIHVLLICSAAALIIWSGLRSFVQDRLLKNAYYPLMADQDTWLPMIWLAGYVVCGAFLEYTVIRRVQPSRGAAAGQWLALGLIFAGVTMISSRLHSPYVAGLWFASLILSTVMLFWAGTKLSRTVEVRT